MKENVRNTSAAFVGPEDCQALMEKGRRLHDEFVFDTFTRMFSWVMNARSGSSVQQHAPDVRHAFKKC